MDHLTYMLNNLVNTKYSTPNQNKKKTHDKLKLAKKYINYHLNIDNTKDYHELYEIIDKYGNFLQCMNNKCKNKESSFQSICSRCSYIQCLLCDDDSPWTDMFNCSVCLQKTCFHCIYICHVCDKFVCRDDCELITILGDVTSIFCKCCY